MSSPTPTRSRNPPRSAARWALGLALVGVCCPPLVLVAVGFGLGALLLARRHDQPLPGAAVGALVISILIAAGCWRRGPSHYFRAIRTDEQVDCGSLVHRHPRLDVLLATAKVSECVARAEREHRPFFAYMEGGGVDSFLATGLAGDGDGHVTLFSYDSDPCGWLGLGPWPLCSEKAEVHRCEAHDPATGCPRP
jgi:hypothetical protein